jgi:hypothetical protein
LRYQLEREITLADIEGKKREKEERAKTSAEASDSPEPDKPDAADPSADAADPKDDQPASIADGDVLSGDETAARTRSD